MRELRVCWLLVMSLARKPIVGNVVGRSCLRLDQFEAIFKLLMDGAYLDEIGLRHYGLRGMGRIFDSSFFRS